MRRSISLGTFAETGRPFEADLDVILRSNALFQANSGGGKSWLLRRMIEQAFGLVPQVVIDPEGEFATLRKLHDFVLVGQGGDTPADVRSAPLLALRLLELGASAVVDLYEMPRQERPAWVAAFVGSLVGAPKRLWRNLLVYVDEAHEMAPEPGHGGGDSPAEKACRHALIDLAAKGRKRGYGCVAATQRLGKLSKDFAAELKNAAIGLTWIDVDRERAAGSLGIGRDEKAGFYRDVKTLAPGSFFVLGRALALEPTLVRIGGVRSEHPRAGIQQAGPPPPTDKIRHLLPQLADLPREAEQKLRTEADLRSEVARLRRELAARPAAGTALKKVEVPVVPPEWRRHVAEAISVMRNAGHALMPMLTDSSNKLASCQEALRNAGGTLLPMLVDALNKLDACQGTLSPAISARDPAPPSPPRARPVLHKNPNSCIDGQVEEVGVGTSGLRRMLVALAQRPGGLTNRQLGVRAGISSRSGTFTTYLSRARSRGWVDSDGQVRRITPAGLGALGDYQPLPEGPALCDHWARELGGGAERMLRALVAAHPGALTRAELGERAGISPTSGTFTTYLSRLRSLELVSGSGELRASEELL